MTTFTNVGEFRRGKGHTRLGPRVKLDTDKKKYSPNDLAIRKLERLLTNLGMPPEKKVADLERMRNAEQLRFMNMPIVAEVLIYLHNVSNNVTQATFNKEAITPYIDRLIKDQDEIVRLRMEATFLRYTTYILTVD